jgi:hypothetical protein
VLRESIRTGTDTISWMRVYGVDMGVPIQGVAESYTGWMTRALQP